MSLKCGIYPGVVIRNLPKFLSFIHILSIGKFVFGFELGIRQRQKTKET